MAKGTEYDADALSALVDHRSEEPSVEYKAWMDLAENEVKAALAKHLCALANYGGGSLVFGVNNDGSHCEPHPGRLGGYSHDAVNEIVSKYLTPSFHCSVQFARSRVTGRKYPVIRVPPHGVVPVCAKRDGPQKGGKPVGISKGVHYTRAPGPKSVPIDSPELWREVIHRCVVNERENLLASIGRLFDRPTQVEPVPDLNLWLDQALARWDEVQPPSGWNVDPKVHRAALAFRLSDAQGKPVEPLLFERLADAIRQAAGTAEAETGFGWHCFWQASGGPHRPTVDVFREGDGYEAATVEVDGGYSVAPTLWRASSGGSGVEVHAYHEDSHLLTNAVNKHLSRVWVPGARFVPRIQAQRVYQFVAFVRSFGHYFAGAEFASLAVDYRGLSGRSIDDPRRIQRVEYRASAEGRRVNVDTSLAVLAGDGAAEAASKLLVPICRLFDGFEIDAGFVRSAIQRG